MRITKATANNGRVLLKLLGILFSVAPPALCTLAYFPIYEHTAPTKLLSLGALLLLVLSFLPIIRICTARLRTPSATAIWLIIFLLFYTMRQIADEMIVISFFATLGNLLGSVFFKLSARRADK